MLATLWRSRRVSQSVMIIALLGICSSAWAKLGVQDFRGSTMSVSNSVSYSTINKSTNLTYNPFFNTMLAIAPRYWVNRGLFVAGRLSLDREWTERDDGTMRDETRLSNLTLRVGALLHRWDFGLLTFVGSGINFPTSPFSQAQTLNAQVNAVIGFIQSLSSWGSLNYFLSVAHNNFRYTTGEIETPRINACGDDPSACSFLNTGVRNAPWVISHTVSLNYFPKSWLFLSASATLIESYLFNRGVDDSSISHVAQEPANKRYLMSYSAEVDVQPTQWLVVAFMMNTFNPQLAPNSTYYRPFFNRNTSFMIDLRFTLGVFRVAQSSDDKKSKKSKKSKKKG